MDKVKSNKVLDLEIAQAMTKHVVSELGKSKFTKDQSGSMDLAGISLPWLEAKDKMIEEFVKITANRIATLEEELRLLKRLTQ